MRLVVACLPWLALLGWLASVSWFLTDDAFISFRYVRNLLEGHGLVFNPGERVEGYSNFLWVLELAAIWRTLGVAPEDAAPWLSVIFTAATIAAMVWWIARLPSLSRRGLVAWMALGLVCSSATFAVWTSGGGLETRQFTFFIVMAVVCLSLHHRSPIGLLAASLSLSAAALTRPEGQLIAVLCFGWFTAQRIVGAGRPRLDRCSLRHLSCLVGPFVALVAAHYLFRYAYYGEWLPNTWYAKHVRPWYESGFRYFGAAALETGLYVLIPLAWVAMRRRWRELRDGTYALVLLLIVVHMAYVMRIGGDHFEYRPLDFYWPLLALPAAEGIARVGAQLAAFDWRRWLFPSAPGWWRGTRPWAFVLFVFTIFYTSAIQAALLFEGAAIREFVFRLHVELDDENAGWLLAAPGMSALVAISNDLRRQSREHFVGSPSAEHREFANRGLRWWSPYANMARRGRDSAGYAVLPDDAVTARPDIGVPSYYLPDVKVIDTRGLTDATVARNPVDKPNSRRIIAHDRLPPPGYLEERNVNITIHAAASSEDDALARAAAYAVKVGPDLWMPFDTDDHQWVAASWAGNVVLRAEPVYPSDIINRNRIYDGGFLVGVGELFIGSFEDGLDGWTLDGEAVTNHSQHAVYEGQHGISGNVGPGFLTSYHPRLGDRTTGRALSPEFTAQAGQRLVLFIAGGNGDDVGVRLLADGQPAAVWRGTDSEHFRPVIWPLGGVAGKRLRLELFDHELGGWGHIMLDHVLITAEPLTAAFVNLPAEHDGENAFRFRVAFSEDIATSYATLRDESFTVTEGEVTEARRVDRRNDLWEIAVEPDSREAVTITLPGGRACGMSVGAVCTGGDIPKPLGNSPSATVAAGR